MLCIPATRASHNRHRVDTVTCVFPCLHGRMESLKTPPTVRQVYALAAALCERMGEEFPETHEGASETIERLRIENGHPAPALADTPRRPPGERRRRSSAKRT